MKKYATLLLTRIHTIYTMQTKQGEPFLIHNGFIAIHHDTILEVGSGDYQHHIDKDTRIIDCYNHIVTPSFIEIRAHLEQAIDDLRLVNERLLQYQKHGTATVNVQEAISSVFEQRYTYTVLRKSNMQMQMPIVYAMQQICAAHPKKLKRFCLSTYDEHYIFTNSLLAAQILYARKMCDAYSLLQALTIHPAKYLGEKYMGKIAKGMLGNLLVFSVRDIHELFDKVDQRTLSQIIHKGVRIYPYVIV